MENKPVTVPPASDENTPLADAESAFKPERENDVDDLVHQQQVKSTEITPEQAMDADDTIHRVIVPPTSDQATTQDPDDLVHGN